jgi:hypothetical protein
VGTVGPPELWGVVVVDCTTNMATLRVKSIEDCNVDTQAVIQNVTACPSDPSDLLNHRLDGVVLFGIMKTPIITKVKNYKEEKDSGGLINRISCDVQIKFWSP